MTDPAALAPSPASEARTTRQWQEADSRHHLHPFTDHPELTGEGARVISHAKGVYLWDTDGRRLLDGMAGLWCVNLGYGRPELGVAARAQMDRLPYYNTFFKTTTQPVVELAERLAALTPGDLDHLFFANSGSEANDTAIRLVRHYWKTQGRPERSVILSRTWAYHGSTIAAASLGGMASMHDIPGIPIPDVAHVMPPYWWMYGGDLSPDAFGLKAAQALEGKILEIGPERVGAFIGEPVMGAGGVLVPPATYWPAVQEILRKYDILLVTDEVICGFGRTGAWFGSQTYDIVPDIMVMAKGLSSGYLPISAVAAGRRVAEPILTRAGRLAHGFTYSGHPVAAAVALETLRILEAEDIIVRVHDDTGPYFQQRLASLNDHPLVGETRGVGLMGAIELTSDRAARAPFSPLGRVATAVRDLCFERGLATRAVREGLVFSPPLVISRSEIDELVEILRGCLDSVHSAL